MSNEKHKGPDNTSPYPISRLAPKFDIVDVGKEIEVAGNMLSAVARGKLQLIEKQMKLLQKQALDIIEKAQTDLNLHKAECRFHRVPNKTYHLYERSNGSIYFSMLSPEEWGEMQPNIFLGSFLLRQDMSWERVE